MTDKQLAFSIASLADELEDAIYKASKDPIVGLEPIEEVVEGLRLEAKDLKENEERKSND